MTLPLLDRLGITDASRASYYGPKALICAKGSPNPKILVSPQSVQYPSGLEYPRIGASP